MAVTYLSITPGPKFWFNRGYVRNIQISNYSTTISWAENVADITIHDPFDYHHYFVFNEAFWTWSSNVYSLDHCLDDVYYTLPGDPTHYPFPIECHFIFNPPTPLYMIQYKVSAAPYDLPEHALPPPPGSYWAR